MLWKQGFLFKFLFKREVISTKRVHFQKKKKKRERELRPDNNFIKPSDKKKNK